MFALQEYRDRLDIYRMTIKKRLLEAEKTGEYDGRKVPLEKPMRGDRKKYKVYVKNDKGNVVKVEFGDPDMEIKRDNPKRRKAFRARHNCDDAGIRFARSSRYRDRCGGGLITIATPCHRVTTGLSGTSELKINKKIPNPTVSWPGLNPAGHLLEYLDTYGKA